MRRNHDAAEPKAQENTRNREGSASVEGPVRRYLLKKEEEISECCRSCFEVQIEDWESFIARSQRRVAALDAQRAAGWPSCKVVQWRNLGVNGMQGEKCEPDVVSTFQFVLRQWTRIAIPFERELRLFFV